MKNSLSSVDVHVLVREVGGVLKGAWFDKAYQVGSRELLLRFRVSGEGSRDLVLAPNYFCLTNYTRVIPDAPSSFAMQLRKRLGGLRLEDVRQHGFDRIVELVFGGRERLVLVAEFFSKGNIILCGEGCRIVGLLEWQKWRHRTLGVGKTYEYPPGGVNALELDEPGFGSLLAGEDRGVVSALASGLGLGGFMAEEVCLAAGVDKNAGFRGLDEESRRRLWGSFRRLVEEAGGGAAWGLVGVDGKLADVQPFRPGQYEGREVREYGKFNDAVDEYFSGLEAESLTGEAASVVDSKKKKIEAVLAQQRRAVGELEEGAVAEKAKGDLIYQHFTEIDAILKFVASARRKGLGDEEVLAGLRESEAGRIVRSLKGVELVLEL